jgi:hypothetical protein
MITTLANLFRSVTWEQIIKHYETVNDYVTQKYSHHLKQIFDQANELQYPLVPIENVQMNIEKAEYSHSVGFLFGDSAVEINYTPWELLLSTPVNEISIARHTPEILVGTVLRHMFHCGKSKGQSDVNIESWKKDEDVWLLKIKGFPMPLIRFKDSEDTKSDMIAWGIEEPLIEEISVGGTFKIVYERDVYEDEAC